ncbi:protein EPIDERMAL PATTERNING FACTOR 2-like protein [Cinnamomum micranthum f. kanehirae]|uniref:Protein EPIDERMAL PATTERNING FACTOR 2-like protein n=1 Tax=Cinnamomum micranthum f. kanehirae TaxID=337451 RepID=A0A443NIU9_9MAGN|nr:protein EPIDERMAL PATTERNING FACTOR 2-like protein [Cinnamomum micranthum f. kanehirae]
MREKKNSEKQVKQELKHGRPELFPVDSGLPDCSHACGPCFPCKRICETIYIQLCIRYKYESPNQQPDPLASNPQLTALLHI